MLTFRIEKIASLPSGGQGAAVEGVDTLDRPVAMTLTAAQFDQLRAIGGEVGKWVSYAKGDKPFALAKKED